MPLFATPPIDRLMRKVSVQPNGCWLYTGATNVKGYAVMWGGEAAVLAHTVSYRAMRDPIPDGMQLDHTCHKISECEGGVTCIHRRCVNPDHLEHVTVLENRHRSHVRVDAMLHAKALRHKPVTQCPQGHVYSPENVSLKLGKYKSCKTCNREYAQKKRLERAVA